MLKYALAASAAISGIVALSAPSYADNTASVLITGHVDAACTITNNTPTIDLGNLSIDGSYTGQSYSASVLGSASCNGNHNSVTATATPLTTSASAATSGFTNKIDYTLTTGLQGIPTLSTVGGTAGSPVSVSSPNVIPAFSVNGSVSGAIVTDTPAGNAKLVAGDYTATVTVTLNPGV